MEVTASDLLVQVRGVKHPILTLEKLHVPSGGKLLVTGPSGAGKTTLLHLLAGLMMPTKGSVTLDGQTLGTLSEPQRTSLRGAFVGLIFQRLNLLEHLTAMENVLLGMDGNPTDEDHARHALDELHLLPKAQTRVHRLSLGEQQRVAVARAVAKQPRLILADEPTSSLDSHNKDAVMRALMAANAAGATLLVVTHDERHLGDFEDQLHLSGGEWT